MAHPRATELRARNAGAFGGSEKSGNNGLNQPQTFADDVPLLDEEAILSKHEMMEQQAVEILEKFGVFEIFKILELFES